MNAKKLFVIACYYDGSNNSIFECVKSIKKYYKSAKIAVIDSNSPDKTYFYVYILHSLNRNTSTFPNYFLLFALC